MVAAAQQSSVVREIVIRGNQRVSKEAILAAMRTKVGQPYLQENLERDRQAILDLGFFSAADVRPSALENNEWRVLVDAQEFPEIKEIRVVGNQAVKTEEIVAAIQPFLKPGDVYNLNSLRPASEAIRALYTRKGFFLGPIEDLSPLAESPGTLNIQLVETRVGTVSVQGNTRTSDRVMRRLIKTRTGETFSIPKWSADLRRILNTQWFESVRSIEDDQTEIGKINLVADVKEGRTGSFNVGLQLDPRNSLAGIIRLSDTNFRGTGQGVDINYIQATRGQGPSIDLGYTNPFFDNKDTSLRVQVYSRLVFRFANAFGSNSPVTDSDQYNERRTGGSVGFNRPLNDALSIGISARLENVTTNNLGTTNANSFIQQDGTVGVFSFGGVMNKRDRDLDPTRGSWARLEIEPGFSNITKVGGAASGFDILGQNTFFRTTAEYRTYLTDGPPLGRDLEGSRRVLALRARYGQISGKVPFFEQFFAGGADSLRGYPEDRFWGTQSLLATAEIRYPIQKAFSVIGFVDYGGAWGGYGSVNNFTQSNRFSLHLGYGVGLSFRTPLGPIRVDLGFNENGGSRTHFLIGTSF